MQVPSQLPTPSATALAYSEEFSHALKQQIAPTMPFDEWMGLVLYNPQFGYYTGSLNKLSGISKVGQALQGDFTTAPELSPWFARTLARQVEQILNASHSNHILEFGAGSGKLAQGVLRALNNPHVHYFILELSADLRARQAQLLAEFDSQIIWLDELPESFSGCVIANEVLDAMPVKILEWSADPAAPQLMEMQVGLDAEQQFIWQASPLSAELAHIAQQRIPALPGYRSEINFQAEAWMRSMGQCLTRGAAILIDYGFPAHEYYHPQRLQGTLMCHFQHHAHRQPFIYPGLQDITAHIDFTAMADAAIEGGLEVLGFTNQARFLYNCGILELLAAEDPSDVMHYARQVGPVQKLLSEGEMGELFKVLLVAKDLDIDPIGFTYGDKRYSL